MPVGVIRSMPSLTRCDVVALERRRPRCRCRAGSASRAADSRARPASSSSGASANWSSMYCVSIARSSSLSALTEPSLARPLGVDRRGGQRCLRRAARTARTGTTGVERHVREQPLHLVGHRCVVLRRRHEPVGRALEHEELGDVVGDRGDELDRARAGADHRDPFAGEIDRVVPLGGVERRSGERARVPRCRGRSAG